MPIVLLIISIILALKLSYIGVFIATFFDTIYLCFILAVLSSMGHPNAKIIKINWSNHLTTIIGFSAACIMVLSLIAFLKNKGIT